MKNHDVLLFEDIEKDGNTSYRGSYIENLEYALKVATFDLYYNIMKIKYMSDLFKEDIRCASNHFLYDYDKDIKALFRVYPHAINLLNDIKNYKSKGIKSSDFKTVSISLPFGKINYSLSEFIPVGNGIAFLNVINAPNPYLIISCYGKENFSSLDKLKQELAQNCDNDYYRLIIFTLSRTQNIYFNKEQFNQLSDKAKFYLYLIHRFGEEYLYDDAIEYSMSNDSFRNSIKEINNNIKEITQEIATILYT